VFDMLETPTSYYAGLLPEGYMFTGATRTPAELRANGAYDLINQSFAAKLNARLIAWGNSESGFYLYLSRAPKRTPDGGIDLTGMKLRSSPTYVPLIKALGGVPVSVNASEIYTGLQRGVIQGFGWTDVAVQNLGVKGLVKYRINPRFYRANTVTIINIDKWKALPQKAKKILDDACQAYEVESVGLFAGEAKKDAAALKAGGMKIITLKGASAKKYLEVAYDGLWARVGTLIPPSELATLRSKFYAQ
jgi:TRAP-type C4-dicarboxylate transport system substrate-binding protein